MSWLFSQALEAAYSEANCSDGIPSAQLSAISTPHPFWCRDKTTEFSRLSRFGLTYQVSTVGHGEALLTWFREAFLAKTFPLPEKAQESPESGVASGQKWCESSTKFDLNTRSWKTHRCLWEEDLQESSVTLPRSGMMQNGVCWERITSELPTKETVFGFSLPTPVSNGLNGGSNSRKAAKERGMFPTPYGLSGSQGQGGGEFDKAIRNWPTPTSSMMTLADMEQAKYSGTDKRRPTYQQAKEKFATPNQRDWKDSGSTQGNRKSPNLGTQVGGQLNPNWVEWLMGWPIGWTDLEPLETDKFQKWQQQHGGF